MTNSVGIKNNPFSLGSQRQISTATRDLAKTLKRLESGMRVDSSREAAATLAVASVLSANSRVISQSIKNLSDANSALSIVDEALGSLKSITEKQQELAEQASVGGLTTEQRTALQAEADALTEEYGRIVSSTNFNGVNLFGTTGKSFSLQVGDSATDTLSLDIGTNLVVTETVPAIGTTINNLSSTGGAGERTTILVNGITPDPYASPDGQYVAGQEELVRIEWSSGGASLTANDNFTIYDQYGSSYNFAFVEIGGESSYPEYTSIYFDQNSTDEDIGAAIANAINTATSGNVNASYSGGTNYVTVSSIAEVDTQDATGSISSGGITTTQQGNVSTGTLGSNPTAGNYLSFQAGDGSQYYVWYRVYAYDNTTFTNEYFGEDPNLAGTGIQVNVSQGDSAWDVAAAISSAINSSTGGRVTASTSANQLVLQNNTVGNVTNATSNIIGTVSAISAGTLSDRANTTTLSYVNAASFMTGSDYQEVSTISFNQASYQSEEITVYANETTLFQISSTSIVTDDSFVLYHNDLAYNFDFVVDGGISSNPGYNHIEISSAASVADINLAIRTAVEATGVFSANYSFEDSFEVVSLSNGYNETGPSASFQMGAISVSTLSDGDGSTSYTQYPDLGGFLVTDRNGNSYSFWYDMTGSGATDPHGGATYSIGITLDNPVTTSTIISLTASAIESAINIYGADFTYDYDADSLTITQNQAGLVSPIALAGSQLNVSVDQSGYVETPNQGLYNRFSTTSGSYYIWYNIDGAGADPAVGGTGIEVDIQSGWTTSQIASAVRSAINLSPAGSQVTTSVSGDVVTITNNQVGAVTLANTGNLPEGLMRVTTTVQGASSAKFSSTSHGLNTGDVVRYNSTGVAAGGLTSGQNYYVIRDSANTFRLASSYSNAMAGTAVTLSSVGTGTQSVSLYNGESEGSSAISALTISLNSESEAEASTAQLDEQIARIDGEIASIGRYKDKVETSIRSAITNITEVGAPYLSIESAERIGRVLKQSILSDSASALLAQGQLNSETVLGLLSESLGDSTSQPGFNSQGPSLVDLIGKEPPKIVRKNSKFSRYNIES